MGLTHLCYATVPCLLGTDLFPLLHRFLHHVCWGGSTSLFRQQPSGGEKWEWGSYASASLPLWTGSSEAHSTQSSAVEWRSIAQQPSPARRLSFSSHGLLLYWSSSEPILAAKCCPMICSWETQTKKVNHTELTLCQVLSRFSIS